MEHKRLRRLPAEWEPQAGIQLTWPHAESDWAPILKMVENCYARIAREIAQREPLLIACVAPEHVQTVAARAGVNLEAVRLFAAPSNDTWARDHGALTIYEEERPVLLDFVFNGWGGRYPSALDDAISRTLHRQGAFGDTQMRTLNVVLEGGSIDSDGRGTILTTSRCLLAPNRNPSMSKEQIEGALAETLGAERVLWVGHGHIAGDDTDCHVDTLARFCDERMIAYVSCREEHDEHFEDLLRMEEDLQALRTPQGESYRLVPLPLPHPCYDDEGARLPATYANFLILNGAVLAPTYGVPEDDDALAILETCFPGRAIVGIDCRSLIMQHGSLHCAAMQFPAGVPL